MSFDNLLIIHIDYESLALLPTSLTSIYFQKIRLLKVTMCRKETNIKFVNHVAKFLQCDTSEKELYIHIYVYIYICMYQTVFHMYTYMCNQQI